MMIEKFKGFLSGSRRMDDAQCEAMTDLVLTTVPEVLRRWYDQNFVDFEGKNGQYCGDARKKLGTIPDFQKTYPDSWDEICWALKLLKEYFENEKRLAEKGKTARKPPKTVPPVTDGTAGRGGPIPPERSSPTYENLTEGDMKEMHVVERERNQDLRQACIAYYRVRNNGRVVCEACGMSFGEVYGDIGQGYIEVHHLKPISQFDKVHSVDPKTDMVPLCANCHAIIHRLMNKAQTMTGKMLEGPTALAELRKIITEGHK